LLVSGKREKCDLLKIGVEALCDLLFLLSLDVGVLPGNLLYFFMLLLCIEVSKRNLLLCGDTFLDVSKMLEWMSVLLFIFRGSLSEERSFWLLTN
jgi:hypothetical protein